MAQTTIPNTTQLGSVNRQLQLASRPVGAPTAGNFHMVSSPVPTLAAGHMLLRTVDLWLAPPTCGAA